MEIATAFASALASGACACALALLTMAPSVSAQIRASEIASVSQIVDGTKITIEYSRPRARGRTAIFGTREVRWDEVWTPGANYATTLEASRDIRLDGHPVPKGKYSMWLVVRKSGPWTLVLDPRAKLFHMEHPDSTSAQLRFPVAAESAPFTEVLTWSFPELSASGATLQLSWIRTRVSVRAEVTPSLAVELPATDAAPYLGRYQFQNLTREDSAKKETSFFVVTYDHGTLKGAFDPADSYMKTFALIRIGPDTFAPGLYDEKGAIYEVLRPDLTVEFTRAGAAAASMEMRDDGDKLEGRALRVP
jgi:DUF2911 family protein